MIDVNVQILYMFGNVVCTPKKGPKLLRFFWNSKCFAGQDFLVTLFSWLFLVEDFKVTLFSLSDPNLSLPLNCESRGLVVSKKGRQVVSANTRRRNSHTYFATRSLRALPSSWRPFGPLDFVHRPLWALRSHANEIPKISENSKFFCNHQVR